MATHCTHSIHCPLREGWEIAHQRASYPLLSICRCHSSRVYCTEGMYRLKLWKEGNIDVLLHEGRCSQKHLVSSGNQMPDQERTARIFNKLMLQSKVNAALRLLSHDDSGGVLFLDDVIPTGIGQNGEVVQQTTRDILMEKHPEGKLAPDDVLLDTSSTNHCHDQIIFEQITGEAIRQAALHTHGAAGPIRSKCSCLASFLFIFSGRIHRSMQCPRDYVPPTSTLMALLLLWSVD